MAVNGAEKMGTTPEGLEGGQEEETLPPAVMGDLDITAQELDFEGEAT